MTEYPLTILLIGKMLRVGVGNVRAEEVFEAYTKTNDSDREAAFHFLIGYLVCRLDRDIPPPKPYTPPTDEKIAEAG